MAQSNSKLGGRGVPEEMIRSEGTEGVQNTNLDQGDSCEKKGHMRETACRSILKGKRIQEKLSKDWNLGTAGVRDLGLLS